jgi:hypothetical protein
VRVAVDLEMAHQAQHEQHDAHREHETGDQKQLPVFGDHLDILVALVRWFGSELVK